jgi:ATP-dependent DNA helicase RecG
MANTLVEVLSHSYFGMRTGKKRTLKIIVRDVSGLGDGRLSLLCFGRNFLEKTIKVGRIYYLYGSVNRNRGELQCSQFELYPATEDGDFPKQFGQILPIYPLRGSLSQRLIRANIKAVLATVDRFEQELPAPCANGTTSWIPTRQSEPTTSPPRWKSCTKHAGPWP